MENEIDFRRATRRVLFLDKKLQEEIPGAGKSAAEDADRHLRIKVTINMDADVVRYFKKRARSEGRAYQSLINQVLREYVDGSRPEQLAKIVKEVLLTDEGFFQALKTKLGL